MRLGTFNDTTIVINKSQILQNKTLVTEVLNLNRVFLVFDGILNTEESNCNFDFDLSSDVGLYFTASTTTFLPTFSSSISTSNGVFSLITSIAGIRMAFLMFDLEAINGEISDVNLEFTIDSDPGDGLVRIYKGTSEDGQEEDLSMNQECKLCRE